jgi:hypothetical protein
LAREEGRQVCNNHLAQSTKLVGQDGFVQESHVSQTKDQGMSQAHWAVGRHHRTRKNITTRFATPKHFVLVKAYTLDKV